MISSLWFISVLSGGNDRSFVSSDFRRKAARFLPDFSLATVDAGPAPPA